MSKLTLSHLRFMLEVQDDPTKRVENLSATRMKLLLDLTIAGYTNYESRVIITGLGLHKLNNALGAFTE